MEGTETEPSADIEQKMWESIRKANETLAYNPMNELINPSQLYLRVVKVKKKSRGGNKLKQAND